MLVKVLDILLPIYVCVGFGFVLGRCRFPWNSQVITPLVLQVSFPMLVIHQFTSPTVTSSGVTRVLLAAVLLVGLFFVLFGALIHLARLPVQSYLAASSLSNVSIGLAIGYLGFGDSGFALCVAFGSVVLLAQFSLGKWLPGGKIEFQSVFHQVVLYALLIGIILMFSGVHFPFYVSKSLQLVGQITIPLLLLSLGFALSEVNLSSFGRGMLFATVHDALRHCPFGRLCNCRSHCLLGPQS